MQAVNRNSLLRWWVLPSGMAVLALASTSHAQPDPFLDYEQNRTAVTPLQPAQPLQSAQPVPSAEPVQSEPAVVIQAAPVERPPASLYRSEAMTWGLGGALQLAYLGGSNESLTGVSEASRGLFLELAPRGSLFLMDNLEVSLALGYLSSLSASSGKEQSFAHHAYAEAGAHYHFVIEDTPFALVPGVGVGGFIGGSSRSGVDAAGAEWDTSATSSGFLVSGYLAGAYQLNDHIRIRSGLTINGTFGSEKPKGSDTRLSTSRAFVGVPVEVTYVF